MLDAANYLNQTLVERYVIEREIGRGASSIVFAAKDMMIKMKEDGVTPVTVAIKILDHDSSELKLNSKSFYAETQAVVGMPTNAHTVAVHDVAYDAALDVHFIVMEYVKGTTLRRYMASRGAFSAREIMSVSLQLLDALRSAHEAGVVHRDVKPQNVLVQDPETVGSVKIPGGKGMPCVKLADFGIARLPGEDPFKMSDRGVGTVHYISPEQPGGREVDARSDLYSLGVLMYELATGRVPFDAESATAVITMHQISAPKHARAYNPEIPMALDQIIFTAMQKDPARRFKDAAAMQRQLEQALRELTEGAAASVASIAAQAAPAPKKAPPKKTRQPMSKKTLVTLLSSVCGVVLVTGLVLFFTLLLPKWTQDGTQSGDGGSTTNPPVNEPVVITVPNLLGEEFVPDKSYGEGVTVVLAAEQYSDSVPKGHIISQSLAAGLEVKGSAHITVVVSLGPEMIEFSIPTDKLSDFDMASTYLIDLKKTDPKKLIFVNTPAVIQPYDASLGAVGAVIGVRLEDGTVLSPSAFSVKKGTHVSLVTNGWGEDFELPAAYRAAQINSSSEYLKSFAKAKSYIEERYEGRITVSNDPEFIGESGYDDSLAAYMVVGAYLKDDPDKTLLDLNGCRIEIKNGSVEIVLVINAFA